MQVNLSDGCHVRQFGIKEKENKDNGDAGRMAKMEGGGGPTHPMRNALYFSTTTHLKRSHT